MNYQHQHILRCFTMVKICRWHHLKVFLFSFSRDCFHFTKIYCKRAFQVHWKAFIRCNWKASLRQRLTMTKRGVALMQSKELPSYQIPTSIDMTYLHSKSATKHPFWCFSSSKIGKRCQCLERPIFLLWSFQVPTPVPCLRHCDKLEHQKRAWKNFLFLESVDFFLVPQRHSCQTTGKIHKSTVTAWVML